MTRRSYGFPIWGTAHLWYWFAGLVIARAARLASPSPTGAPAGQQKHEG